jgi:hypothetical protein
MPNVACPVCGTEYAGWSVRCPSCGTALTPAVEVDPTNLADDEKVVYELGEWPLEVQAEAAQVMAESGIPHTWDDTDLVVHLDFEEQVDALLEEVEREAIANGQLEPSGDSEGDGAEVVYDLSDWGEADRQKLDKRLDEGDVPHLWEGTSLVVAATDEAMVEELLDAVEHPDALAPEPDDTDDAADDEVRHELLSDLFDAADRLKRDPGDDRGLEELTEVLGEADEDRPPYGFPPAVWRAAIVLAGELGDLLVVASGGEVDDEEGDAEQLEEAEVAEGLAEAEAMATREAAAVVAAGREPADIAKLKSGEPMEKAAEAEAGGDPEAAVARKAAELRDLLRPYV